MQQIGDVVEASALREALRCSWSASTSNDASHWSPENPAHGQCAVTALVVQDHLGGTLRRCDSPTGSHYFNVLPDSSVVDLTAEQFGADFVVVEAAERAREYVLSFPSTSRRYQTLRAAVEAALSTVRA
jgi:hypothetical protein